MKYLTNALILTTLLITSNAHAIANPFWERPILQASMEILDAEGSFDDIESANIILTKRDNSEEATGIRVDLVPVTGERRVFIFKITDIKRDRCGSTYYTGILDSSLPYSRTAINLVDKVNFACTNTEPYRIFDAEIVTHIMCTPNYTGKIKLQGEPMPVFTKMDVEE